VAKDKTVAVFTKGPFEEVRATITTFKGKRLAAIRIYANYDADDEDEYRPTAKGVSLKLKDVHHLKKAVDALFDAATQELEAEDDNGE
jgi:Transcriptional Coactivator p15 (PC4)